VNISQTGLKSMGRYDRRDWNTDLALKGKEVGFEVVRWDGEPTKRNKVLIRCQHKEQWVYPHGQLNKTHCCRTSSKQGQHNPAYGKPQWNSGTVGISTGCGYGGIPKGENREKPGILYLVEYTDQDGDHIKIGITSTSIKQRLKGKLKNILFSLELPLGECWDREQDFLSYFSEFRYSSCSSTELISSNKLHEAIAYLKNDNFFTFTTPTGLV